MNDQIADGVFRVLCLDGGGMRGIYSAAYLDALLTHYQKRRDLKAIDFGKAFKLICGTSTGAILACALAKGVPMKKVIDLYHDKGRSIFPLKIPKSIWGAPFLPLRKWVVRKGAAALEEALNDEFQGTLVRDIWRDRQIGLAIPAVEMGRHSSWVFKTPHLDSTFDRDGGYSLTQVCLASTAAPVYRSMAYIPSPDLPGAHTFIDGGLWANNPVLVGLIDAIKMTEPGDTIHIFCLGTCPPPSGHLITKASQAHRGPFWWRFGGVAAEVSITAQQYAYDNMARMLAVHVGREVKVVRFPKGDAAAGLAEHLDLDETKDASMKALVAQAQTDAFKALSSTQQAGDEDGSAIHRLFMAAPAK